MADLPCLENNQYRNDKQELHEFLTKVNKIEGIIKGLASKNEEEVSASTEKADEYLSKELKVHSNDRTCINSSANKTDLSLPLAINASKEGNGHGKERMDRDAFMLALQSDAEDRAMRQKKCEQAAHKLKEEANEHFRTKDFEKSIQVYTKAIGKMMDMTCLYTNRAIAYINIERYDDAIADCDTALLLDESNLKALLHKGKALMKQNKFEKSEVTLKKASEDHPDRAKVVDSYLQELEREKFRIEQAISVINLDKKTKENFVENIRKVKMSNQIPMYYVVGFTLLEHSLQSGTDKEKTLFAIEGGFNVSFENTDIARYLCTSELLTEEEADVVAKLLSCFAAACSCHQDNKMSLLSLPILSDNLVALAGSAHRRIHQSCQDLLLGLMSCDYGTELCVAHLDIFRLLDILSKFATIASAGATPVQILKKLSKSTRCRSLMACPGPQGLATFSLCDFASSMVSGSTSCLSAILDVFLSLCKCPTLRLLLSQQEVLLEKLTLHLEEAATNGESQILILLQLLRLHRLLVCCKAVNTCRLPDKFEERVLAVCWRVHRFADATLTSCSLHLADSILSKSSKPLSSTYFKHLHLPSVFEAVKRQESTTVALKILLLAKSDSSICQKIANNSDYVVALLRCIESSNPAIVGNAALCLANCVDENNALAKDFSDDEVKKVLTQARDADHVEAKRNCAILMAKLCTHDMRILNLIRTLEGGLSILHQVAGKMKFS